MKSYSFNLVQYEKKGHIADNTVLGERPFTDIDRSFAADARRRGLGRIFNHESTPIQGASKSRAISIHDGKPPGRFSIRGI